MMKRRILTALVGTTVAGLGMAALAAPAQADTPVEVEVAGTLTLSGDELTWKSGSAEFTPVTVEAARVSVRVTASVDGKSGEEFYLNADGLLTDVTDPDEPRVCVGPDVEASWCYLEQDDTYTYIVDPSASNQHVTIRFNNFPTTPTLPGGFYVSYPVTPPAPDTGGTGSAGTAPASVLLQALDLFGGDWMPADESSLVGWEKTVPVNTWQALPESGDVVGVGENEGKVFLGVATTPDFPVAIAQRQVENGWGAYQAFDADGELASVFIPAGGSMFVWTQPRLYSVWGTA